MCTEARARATTVEKIAGWGIAARLLIVAFAIAMSLSVASPASASSTTSSYAGGVSVIGGDEPSAISVSYDNTTGRYVISDSGGITPYLPCQALGALEVSCPRTPDADGGFLVNVLARGGDDVVRLAYPGGNGLGWYTGDRGRIQGDSGDDELGGSPGADAISAGWDDDVVDGAGGGDLLYGEGGSFAEAGLVGKDTLYGGPGSDKVEDSDSADREIGDDVLDGGVCSELPLCPSAGLVESPDDADLVAYARIQPMTVDLDQSIGGQDGEHDVVRHFEDVRTYGGADHLIGDERDNYLLAGAGRDRVEGGGGDDYLDGGSVPSEDVQGGAGDDLHGGAGDDILDGGSKGPWEQETLADGRDLFDGGPGLDLVTYGDRVAAVDVDLRRQEDQGAPGENDHTVAIEAVEGGWGDDRLRGNGLPNALFGLEGEDALASNGDPGVGDLVDCGPPDDLDSAVLDRDDLVTDCEHVELIEAWPVPPLPHIQFTPPGVGTAAPRLVGPRRERSSVVDGRGRFTLRQRAECPGPGSSCRVRAKATMRLTERTTTRRRRTRAGAARRTLRAGAAMRVALSLNAAGRRELRRRGSLEVRVEIVIRRGAVVRRKTITARLRRASRSRSARLDRLAGLTTGGPSGSRAARLKRIRDGLPRPQR